MSQSLDISSRLSLRCIWMSLMVKTETWICSLESHAIQLASLRSRMLLSLSAALHPMQLHLLLLLLLISFLIMMMILFALSALSSMMPSLDSCSHILYLVPLRHRHCTTWLCIYLPLQLISHRRVSINRGDVREKMRDAFHSDARSPDTFESACWCLRFVFRSKSKGRSKGEARRGDEERPSSHDDDTIIINAEWNEKRKENDQHDNVDDLARSSCFTLTPLSISSSVPSIQSSYPLTASSISNFCKRVNWSTLWTETVSISSGGVVVMFKMMFPLPFAASPAEVIAMNEQERRRKSN